MFSLAKRGLLVALGNVKLHQKMKEILDRITLGVLKSLGTCLLLFIEKDNSRNQRKNTLLALYVHWLLG